MVAIVAGNGLGLLNTSLNIIGEPGVLGQSVLGQSNSRAFINAVTGNLVLQTQDEQLAGRGLDLCALRTYNSLGPLSDGDGGGWRLGYEQTVRFQGPGTPAQPNAGATVIRTGGDGHQTAYSWEATRAMFVGTEGSGAHDELKYDNAASEWAWTDGTTRAIERYSNSTSSGMTGRLIRCTDTSGNSIALSYDGERLTLIRDIASQQELRLKYGLFNGATRVQLLETRALVGDALGDPLRQVAYDYDSSGRLTTATMDLTPSDGSTADGAAFVMTYGYDGIAAGVASVTTSDGTNVFFKYDPAGRVSTVSDRSSATASQFVFSYSPATNSTDIADGNGQVWTYRYDASTQQLTEVRTPAVGGARLSTRFAYDARGNLIGVTDARDNTATYGYDGNGNRTLERDALGNTVTHTFSAANQMLTQTRYRTADPDGAGPQSAKEPLTARYAYDANARPRFVVTPEGRVTENRYGTTGASSGLLTHTLRYTGRLFDVAGLGPAEHLTEAQLTAWQAGLPDKRQAQLVEYGYDLRGNVSRETSYATVDATGAGVLDDQASVTEYHYDAHSRLLRRTVVRGSARDERSTLASFGYDGMGRVVTGTDAQGTRTTTYDDANSRITVTATSGLTDTRRYDSRGRLSRFRQSDDATTRETRYVYDNSDQLRMVEDAQGGRRYRFYDAAGRLEFSVDATGAVTRSERNPTGHVVRQTQYLQRADPGSWYDSNTQTVTKLSLTVGGVGSDVPTDAGHDRVATFEYDGAGRLRRTTDATGTVTTTSYDGASRVTMTQTGDRVTLYLYDKDDLQVGVVDPLGFLTEQKYDAGRRLTETVRYGQRSTAAGNLSAPVWIGLSNQTAIAGKPFEYRVPAYDPDGDQPTVSVVGTPPNWLSFDAGTATLLGTAPAAGTEHRVTLHADDGRGRTSDVTVLIAVINPLPDGGPDVAGPTWVPLSPLDELMNAPVNYIVPGASGTSLTYRVVSGLPVGLSFNAATRTISGAASGIGFSTVVLRATKAGGQSVERTLSVRIRSAASPPDQPAGSDQLSAWRPVDPSALHSHQYCDGQGRVVGAVDERQFLTETVHDDARNSQRTLRYLTPVTVNPGDTLASLRSRGGAFRQTSLVQYDGLGRILVTTGPDASTQTRNEHDEAGRLTRVVSAVHTAEQRARRTFYNAFGEVTATLGGEGDASLGTNPSPNQISQAISDYGIRSEYDTLGRAVRTVDANGNKTLLYYDRENRLTHTISLLGQSVNNTLAGEVSETMYTSFGQAASVRRYATRLTDADMDQLLAAGGGGGSADQVLLSKLAALADPDLDSLTSSEYDRSGRLDREVDGERGVTVNVYDPHGELAAQVRSLSQGRATTTQFDYDLAGRVVSRTDDVGGINANTQTAYDAFGRIARSADGAGNVTTTAYQDSGRVVVVTDPLHRAMLTEYEAFGRVLRAVNALNQQAEYTYDDSARTVTVTTPEKVQATTARTRHDEIASITDGRGNTTAYAYNKDGQQTTVTDPLGQVTTRTTYDRSGRTHDVIDARGTVTRFGYDQRNRVIERRVDPAGLNLTTRSEFDPLGRQVQVTVAATTVAAQSTTYIYDRKGRVKTEIVDPGGRQLSTNYSHDDRDNVVAVARGTVSRPNQHVDRYEFDSLGRRTKEIASPSSVFGAGPPGTRDLTTQYRYDVGGRMSCRTDARRMGTWQVYDAAGQLTHTISALGDVSENRYDAVGRLTRRRRCAARLGPSTVDGFGDIVGGGFVVPPANQNDRLSYVVYDNDGRTRFTLKAAGSSGWTISENRHDANANVIESRRYDRFLPNTRVPAIDSASSPGITVSEMQNELSATLGYHDNTPSTVAGVPCTRFAYDANNRLRFAVDPLGSVAESTYDPAGNVLSTTRFASRPTLPEYTETAIDAAVDRTENDNSVTHSAYDVAGRLRYMVDALGSVRENRYDARGNVVTRVRWATRPKPTQYSENAITAALAAMPASGDDVTHLVYDAGNRLRFTIDALGSVSENGCDAVGNILATTRFASRPAAPFPPYTESEVDAAVDPLRGDRANQITRFAHDPNNRLRFTIDALGSITEKVYDAVGNVVVTTRFAVRPALHQYTENAIDAAVAPLRGGGANSTTRFVYDGDSRLRYTVDALGSITERVYDTVGNPNRVLRLAVRPPLTAYSEGALNAAVAPLRDDPGNQVQHSVHDAAGQIRFSVQRVSVVAGQFRYSVTRHELDAFGRSVGTISYATAVPLSGFSESAVSAAVGSGDAARDRVSRFVPDLAGHQSYILSAVTFEANSRRYQITAQQFDPFGRRVSSTTYATAVAVPALDKAAIDAAVAAVADATRDRSSAAAYDPSDQMVYDIRLLGPVRHQVMRQEYDALGRIAKTTRYARAVGPLTNVDQATMDAAVSAIAGPNDRKTLYVYDAAGRQRFLLTTDASPHWTVGESRYDVSGNVIESRRYDRQVTDAWVGVVDRPDSPGVTELEMLDQLGSLGYSDNTPSTLANVQRTRFALDTSNQLRFTVDALGSVAENRYDALGRVGTTVRFATRPSLTAYTEEAIAAAVDSDDGDNQLQQLAYDANGQPRFTVHVLQPNSGSGGQHRVTEQRYDALGQPVESYAYASAVGHLTAYDEPTIAAAILRDPHRDRRSATAYDPGGRPAYTVRDLFVGRDGGVGGVVTKHVYDGLRQLVQRVDYAVAVRSTQIDIASIEGVLLPDPADRATAYVHDAGGRQRFELHPDLTFQESEYDALSQVTQTRQFDFPLPSDVPRTEAEMVALRGGHTVGDGVTRGQAHTYDAAGRLTSTRDALNNVERYEYSTLGDRTKWIDKNGAGWACEHDRKGQKTKEASPPVQFTISGEPLGTAAPNRVLEIRYGYDAFGNLTSKIEAANLPTEARTTELRYDTVGQLTSTRFPGYYDPTTGRVEMDPAPGRFRREATTLHDPLGNTVRTSVRIGAGALQHTYRTYDRQARLVHEVNPLNNVTQYTYTLFDEPEVVTRYSVTISAAPANGLYWTAAEVDPQLNWGHDENGNVLPDADARPITVAYDKQGRKVSVIQPTATYYTTHTPGDPSQNNYYRPNAGSVVGVDDAAVTMFEYNAFGDLVRQRVRINNIVEWQDTSHTYDTRGRRTGSVNAAGHVTTMRYDALGNLVRTDEPSGFSNGTDRNTAFAYNALNQQTRVDRYGLRYTDAAGVEHGIAYWTWEDGGHWVDPDADVVTTVKTTTYDGDGRVLDVTDGVGNVTSTRYNPLGQLIAVIEPARLVAPISANGEGAVDPFRNQVSETPVTSLTVNAFGRVVRMVLATSQSQDARDTLQTFDAADELLSTTDAEGNVKLRSYDFAGRVVSETQAINADLGPLGINRQRLERRYAYDALGQPTDTLDAYVDGGDLLQSGRAVVYNPFGEIVEERRKWGSAGQRPEELDSAVVTWNHFDNAGHVVEKLAADGLTVCFYDLQGQVTREERRGNSTDADGTRTRITENQYDVLGRLVMTRKPAFDADITPETGTTTRLVTPYVARGLDRWGNLGSHEDGGYEFVNGQPVYAPSRIFRGYQYDDGRLVGESFGTHGYVTSSGVSTIAQVSKVYFHDLLGNVVREVDEARDQQTDVLLSSRTRRKAYTSVGQLRAEIDATGRTVEHAYSIHSNRLGTRNARGTVLFDRYDRNGSIRFSGVLRTTSPSGVGEYNSFTGTGTIIRTYLSAHQYDQANRRFASKTFVEGADAPWSYTWLDGRNFGVFQRNEVGIVRECRYDQFGNKSVEMEGGARTEWTAATEDYVVGRIASYRLPGDTGFLFGTYNYNDFGEIGVDAVGNARTEYDHKNNGLLGTVTIFRDVATPNIREVTLYDYDARGQLTSEARFDTGPTSASSSRRYFSYDWQGRLVRAQDNTKVPFKPSADVRYAYDEWNNVRRMRADYMQTFAEGPRASESWNTYDNAGRMTLSNGKMIEDRIGLKLRTPGSVEIDYDDVGRRSRITEFLRPNHISRPTFGLAWDTVHDERYGYDDLGHLRRIEQRIRHIHVVRSDDGSEPEAQPNRVGDWQPLSSRSVNLRGDVTRAEQWSRIFGTPGSLEVDFVPVHLSTTTTAYRPDGQVTSTDAVADNRVNSTRIANTYTAQTGLLESYEFTGHRSDETPYTTTFTYQYTLQDGNRVVRRISDTTQGLDTIKTYDPLGRLSHERVELPNPDGGGSDRYDERLYEYSGEGRIVLKDSRLRLSSSGPGTDDLPTPSTGQLVYVGAANRTVAMVGGERLAEATRFDFAYTPMSEAASSGASRYVVRNGDMLIDIAQAVYGDSALWQLIAEANGIAAAPDELLPATEVGKAYEIPGVIRSSNSATTFTPYNAAVMIGNDRPIVIPPLPPPQYSEITRILVTAASIAVEIGVTVGLSALGVPLPLSSAIGAGLGNLAGQGATWGLGMQAPDHRGIDWGDVGAAAAQGPAFGPSGVVGVVGREIWQEGRNDFRGWTNGSGPNPRGIAGSLFNIGAAALRPALSGPPIGRFNVDLAGLINSAYNPSSGWAIPATGKTPFVGAFEYAASTGHNWILDLIEPTTVITEVSLDAGSAWEERLHSDDRQARNEQITAASNELLQLRLLLGAAEDLVNGLGEDIDDSAIVRSVLAQRYEERMRRVQTAKARYAARMAILSANTARLAKQMKAGVRFVSETPDIEADLIKWMYADGTLTRFSQSINLDGLNIERGRGVYDMQGMYDARPHPEYDAAVRSYQEYEKQHHDTVGLEIVEMFSPVTPAEQARRLGLATSQTYREFVRTHPGAYLTPGGAPKAFVDYHNNRIQEISTNWAHIDHAYGSLAWAPFLAIDPAATITSVLVGSGTTAVLEAFGVEHEIAAGFGGLASIATSAVTAFGRTPQRPSVESVLRAERAARADYAVARLAARPAESEASMAVRTAGTVGGGPARSVPLAPAGAEPTSGGGSPPIPGRDYVPTGYPVVHGEGETLLDRMHRSDALPAGGIEPKPSLIANISDGSGGFTGGTFRGDRGMHVETFPLQRKARQGSYSGTPGNSDFTPNRDDALVRAGYSAIRYRGGNPDFNPFAEARVLLPRSQMAIPNRAHHNSLADRQLAMQRRWLRPDGSPDVARAQAYRTNPANPFTWHHVEQDNVLLLVPRPIHEAAQHAGGFSSPYVP